MSIQTITVAQARSDMQARADASAALERDQQVDALQKAGLLRSVSPDLVGRYARLEPGQRDVICDELAGRRFASLLSEQIIADRGEAGAAMLADYQDRIALAASDVLAVADLRVGG